jgi:hypothetical protein
MVYEIPFFYFCLPGSSSIFRKSGSGSIALSPNCNWVQSENLTLEERETKEKKYIYCDVKGGSGSAMRHNQCRFITMVVYTSYQVAAIDLRHRSRALQLIS